MYICTINTKPMWQQNYGLSVSQNIPEAYDVYIDIYLYTRNGMSVLKRKKKFRQCCCCISALADFHPAIKIM